MPVQKISSSCLPKPQKPEHAPVSFGMALAKHDIHLTRNRTHTLQVNTGLLCNQTCRHCHLNAGPGRKEIMSRDTADQVAHYAKRAGFNVIDITGGAPELNPDIAYILNTFARLAPKLVLRSNLSVLSALKYGDRDHLMSLLKSLQVVIVTSFPSLSSSQTDAQRGDGIFTISIEALQKLNRLGYGHMGSGLELNLVSNPAGAFLPPSQEQTENRFRHVLKNKYGIVFNNLLNFANVPLGRFRQWLIHSGNFEAYMQKLINGFNPCAVDGVMCRTLVSMSWDGYLFDCDFNLARNLYLGNRKIHVSQMQDLPAEGSSIATADHCYTCTAGTGFT